METPSSCPNEGLKLITLNCWGDKVLDPLLDFLNRYKATIDLFCFQEVFNGVEPSIVQPDGVPNLFSRLVEVLTEHVGYFSLAEQTDMTGQATFVRDSILVGNVADHFIYRWRNAMVDNNPATTGRSLQYVQFTSKGKPFTVANMHGLWNGQGKYDSLDRIQQSLRVRDLMDRVRGPKVLCGDFNLLPTTGSLEIIENGGLRNLVKDFEITSTRSKLYTKPEKYADYILVSPEVEVRDFKVLPDVVSDHLPLYLEFA